MMKKLLIVLIFFGIQTELLALEYRSYQFGELVTRLGYPSKTFFGSSEQEIYDLNLYTDQEDPIYQEINGYLRYYPAPYEWYGTGPEDAAKLVASIDRIFEKVPTLPEDLILFRGLSLSYRQNKSFAIDEEIKDLGYVSTSVDFKIAHHFAVKMNEDFPEKKKAIFVMYLNSAHQRGILIDQGEDEIILKRGQLMKVMAIKSNKDQAYETYLVQICQSICQKNLSPEISSFWSQFRP